MIEKGRDEVEYALIPSGFGGIAAVWPKIEGRLLLRPQGGGRLTRFGAVWMILGGEWFHTRAQAAQAVYSG